LKDLNEPDNDSDEDKKAKQRHTEVSSGGAETYSNGPIRSLI
jgi:hypothetical protein